jgi:polysaccharide biosynthesis/export protein
MALASCSEVLQSPTLKSVVDETAGEQEEFEVVVKPLTLAMARDLQSTPYPRRVMQSGIGASAGVVSEGAVTRGILPPDLGPETYRLGVGDQLTFAQFAEGGVATINEMITSDNGTSSGIKADQVISSTGRVGSDGSVLLLGLGKLDVGGKTLNEARDLVRNSLIRSGIAPRFQLEISGFNSQKIFLASNVGASIIPLTDQGLTNDGGSNLIPLTDQGLTLKELIIATGKGIDGSAVVVISIQRQGREYRITTEELLKPGARDIYLRDQDQVVIEAMGYKPGQVFVLGAVAPVTIPISPEKRETMADILFTPDGVLASPSAQRSEVYLLRGSNPVEAFKLDATDPTRIVVAAAMELRPNDIIFVPEQPLSSLNRTLRSIAPLRLLIRDLQAGAIP